MDGKPMPLLLSFFLALFGTLFAYCASHPKPLDVSPISFNTFLLWSMSTACWWASLTGLIDYAARRFANGGQ